MSSASKARVFRLDHSQKKFNTGMVIVVEHGKTPSRELIYRTTGSLNAGSTTGRRRPDTGRQ